MEKIEPLPTTRAVIDPLRLCPLLCKFCYYRHSDRTSVFPWDRVERQIDAAAERGNTAADVTGGEPLVYPDLERMIEHATLRRLRLRIITSLVSPRHMLVKALRKGVKEFLVSVHGLHKTHDDAVQFPARAIQLDRLPLLRGSVAIDINCVITRLNQAELEPFAEHLVRAWRPRVVNFINFNPHHQWRDHPDTPELIADLNIVEAGLNAAIRILEAAGIGVNVRYYPMCRIAPAFRRCVSNDLHVVFDTGEWDYDIKPKTFERFRDWAIELSNKTEEKGPPCDHCDIRQICGGANRYWHAAARSVFGEVLQPQRDASLADKDFWYYRRDNGKAMIPR